MNWKIKIPNSAQRELDRLPDNVWQEGIEAIADLREDPLPYGSILLEGYTDLYRIRFYRNQYRIVYRVSEQQRRVIIMRVRPRGSAYQGL